MKKILISLACFWIGLMSVNSQKQVAVKIDPGHVENRINDKIYGFLLEHLYHSVSNGIWGENVWNRSFEELLAYGNWEISSSGEVMLDAMEQSIADFRIFRGKDYDITLDVKRQAGDGAILIGVRDQHRDRMLTNRVYWYLGSENNTVHKLESNTGWIWHTPKVKTTVTDVCPGALVVGKWVQIRIRCEENHLTGWINGTKIFDRIIDDCPVEGAVTLGGEHCQVAFRNIKITSLDGNDVKVNLNPVRHWYGVGDGTVAAVNSDVLNQNIAMRIHSLGRFAGVEQPHNYSIRKSDLLKGSIYLKGTVDKVYIQLLDGKKILSEKLLQNITDTWKEYLVELPSDKDVSLATLRIVVKEPGNLFIDQVSLMHQSSIENQGFRVELTNAVASLKPTILRWPGGSFSEQYHFENGLGKQSERKGILRWDDFDPLSFGTDEFMAFCEKVGAEPQIVVPIGYHNYAGYMPDKDGRQDWLQRALDWMEYCNGDAETTKWGKKRAENGHPEPYNVKYWEIDNEVWKMDPKLYAEITRLFSIEMKKQDPSIKIIGCGCGRLGREGIGLDSIMIHDVAGYIDYISPHYYQMLDRYGNEGVEEYGCYLDKLSSWIAKSENPAMKIYLSEWNLDGIDMRTGLFTGGFLNRLEATPGVEMAASALFLRHTSATGWNNAFINFDQNGWFQAPNYVVMKLWRDHFQPNRIAVYGDMKGLNVIATISDNRKETCLKIVNPAGQPVAMKIRNGINLGMPVWKVIHTPSLLNSNSMSNPDKIKVENREVMIDGEDIIIAVPAFSASVLTMQQE